jgi:hypothetical protein
MHNPRKAAPSLTLFPLLSKARKSNLQVNILNTPTISSFAILKTRTAHTQRHMHKASNYRR